MNRGLWIPPHILFNQALSHSDKMVAALIYSFRGGFFGTDRDAADLLGLNLRTVERIMANLTRERIIYRRDGARICVEDVS